MELAGFGVESWLNEYETQATYDIAQSTIESMTVADIMELNPSKAVTFNNNLAKSKMNYGSIEGSDNFKQQVAKLYDHMDYHNILQTNGATGANLVALYGLIEPGDHVISEYPSYQQLIDIPKSFGAEVDYWRIYEDNDWYPKISELKQLIRPNTKMICLNNANNPTGTILDREFLEQVVQIAKSVGAYILVDEVYLPLIDSDKFVSIVDLYDKGIATNSLSKTYSTPGIRVGWVASNKELADLFRKVRDYTMICSGVYSDDLACFILENRQKVIDRNTSIVKTNLKILRDWLETEPKVSCILPAGVSISFIKLDIKTDTVDFCKRLLKEKGVLLVPGECFDTPKHARLGYCTNTETLKTALKLLSEFLINE